VIRDAAYAFSGPLFTGLQVATFFEAMKNWVHRPGTDLISMADQLFTHARAKNRSFFCVMQNVQTDHAGIEVAIARNYVAAMYSLQGLVELSLPFAQMGAEWIRPERSRPPGWS
jgi:hypothetical protein